jgi:hypothetical protein
LFRLVDGARSGEATTARHTGLKRGRATLIIDHRTYTLIPGKLPGFLKFYEEVGFPIQTKYLGDPIGWYVSMDIGELNQVVHMWGYEDIADRAARRAKLAADPAWGDYLKEGMTYMQKMENKILTPAPFFNS